MQRLMADGGRAARVALAIALTGLAAIEVWSWAPDADEGGAPISLATRLLVLAVAAAVTSSPALPRRLRLLALVPAVPAAWLAFGGPIDTSIGLTVALGLVVLLAAAESRGRLALAASALGAGAIVAAGGAGHPDAVAEAGDLLVLVAAIGGPWLAGAAWRLRRERESQLLETATADERARIARELHDVVAHAISIIVIQSRGGRRSLDRDPAAAAAAFDAIEATAAAARALVKMRGNRSRTRIPDSPAAARRSRTRSGAEVLRDR